MLHQRVFDNCQHTVIINADDFGVTPSIDKGIVQLLLSKRLSSISAIVNESNSEHAAKLILKMRQENRQLFQKVSIGLHFNLTRGQPLSQLMKKANIVEKGKFQKELVDQFLRLQGSEQLIAEQFRKQVKKFITLFQRRPSHVDGHNHVHLYPTVAKAISSLMTQFGIYRIRMLRKSDLSFYGQFLKSNIEKIREAYESKHIIWPDVYLGQEDSGNLKVQKVKKQIEKDNQRKTIQLMCHPGYPNSQGLGWTSKNDRLMQKQQLQSQQFGQFSQHIGGYSSYLDLQVKKSSKNPLRLLIYSKLEIGTGNYTTTLRYKAIFQRMGYQVYTWSAQSDISSQIEAEDLQKFLTHFGISLILGINVSRSAKIIHEATHSSKKIRMQVPYILVVAGTDANYTFQSAEQYEELSESLRWSQCIVSLSNDMTKITQNVLQELMIQKNVYTIVQSSLLGQLKPSQKVSEQMRCEQKVNDLAQSKKYILFPTSFRRIKCLNELIDKYGIQVYVLGPIIQKEYYEQVKVKFNKIKYLGTLSQFEYSKRLNGAFAVINCSQTEGMSCSILEAIEFGIPVVARGNSGNKQLISHTYNGLIYESSEDFIKNIQSLLQDQGFRETIIHNAKKMFKEGYSLAIQEKKFGCMIQKQIKNKIMELNSNSQCIRIFNQSYVHNTSQVNNRLYQQIEAKIHQEVRILDFGCGTSIFSLLFILKANPVSKIKLYLLDINHKILGNALYNCRQSSAWHNLQITAIIQQKFLQKYGKQQFFDVILFNPPQTPFRKQSSRLDKNGGINGIKFYESMLKYFSESKSNSLYMLHSFLAWPQRIKQLLSYYKLRCVWQSEKGFHHIMKQDYDKMEDNLSDFILKHWKEGKADISFENDCFSVPAEIKLIIKDDDT